MTSQGELATVITTVHPDFLAESRQQNAAKIWENRRDKIFTTTRSILTHGWLERLFAIQNSRFKNMSKVLPRQSFALAKVAREFYLA
ncbi:hypothetical protein [Bartonella choladocola]|uniref:hypothetical protein n=1 Tax=Bartonella choladocola TaxID=2750995 RepID=UPI00098F3E80|nr:hypothetical protein [Bartonella choladocola]